MCCTHAIFYVQGNTTKGKDMFIVTTQTLENYGSHADSGKFADGHSYWKFKGGDTYLVEDLDRAQDALAFVAALVLENNISFKEYPSEIMTVQEWADNLPDDADFDQSTREYYLSQVKRVSPNTGSRVRKGMLEQEVA